MSPNPSTALPSVTTATVLFLMVRFQTFAGSSAIACETRATPGVYAIERSSRVFSGAFETTSSLPPRCIRSVRSETCSTSTPSSARTASTMRSRCPLSDASTLTSRIFFPCSTRTRSIESSSPPASPIASARSANEPGRFVRCTRSVALKEADGCVVAPMASASWSSLESPSALIPNVVRVFHRTAQSEDAAHFRRRARRRRR